MPDATMTDIKTKALAFAEKLAETSGLEMTARVANDEGETLTIAFEGPDARLFVGRNGQVLDTLQYLATLIVNRRSTQRLRIVFDADSYRARRETTLIKLAQDIAAQVKGSGEEAVLDPLSPLERRIVHNALSDDPGVRTYSEGEEPDRFIIISPAG